MSKRGSTPAVRNHHPPITRTTSVGYQAESNGQHMFFSSSRLNGFADFGSNPSLYPGPSSANQLALERTSSLGKLSEKPYREHKMKTISETQLGGVFSDEDFSSDRESSSCRIPALEEVHEHMVSEELCSIDESLTSDDCSTQSSTDTCTQITSSEIIDVAATAAANKGASSSPQRLEKLGSPSLSSKFSPTKSPNISPLHQRLQCSLSTESREKLQGPMLSPTFRSTSTNGSSLQLKSILRSPTASITSLSSISPTHSISSEQRLSIQTPPMPSTPTSTSADRAHSVLMDGSTMAHSHTILPTGNNDALKNDKSPSPSPSMDFEVVACKTVVSSNERFCDPVEQQWPRGRSQSDTTSNNTLGGMQFHVTLVKDADPLPSSSVSALIKEESNNRMMSPMLLHTKCRNPLPIIRQASDSAILSPRQTNGRPHRVMFSDCTQVRSFDSESNDSDADEIKIVCDDVTIVDLTNAEREDCRMVLDSHESNGLPQSPRKCSKVSDKVELCVSSSLGSQQMAFVSTADTSGAQMIPSVIKEDKRCTTQSFKDERSRKSTTPTHKRITGKNTVRELSQIFESTPSPEPMLSPSSTVTSPSHQRSRKISTTKIPVLSEAAVDIHKLNNHHPSVSKVATSRNNLKASKVPVTPPKVASKPAKRKVSTAEKLAAGSNQSPAAVRKTIPARRNSVCQRRTSVTTKPTTAMRRPSRTEHIPIAISPRHTTNPDVAPKKYSSTNSQSSPNLKLKSPRSQTTASGKEAASPSKKTKLSVDSNPPRSKLQRQPSVVSSRSPSPYSSGQATHKPLSRLSGTRQPLRRKSGSNNSSPAAARKTSQTSKSTTTELNCNNSNNNNSCLLDENDLGRTNVSCPLTFQINSGTDTSASSSQESETSQYLRPKSLQTVLRIDSDTEVSQCVQESPAQENSGSPLNGSAVRGEVATLDRKSPWSQRTTQNVMLNHGTRYHPSRQSLTLKLSKKRDPFEWQNFGLSWKQSSLPFLHSTDGRRTITSRHL